MNDNIVCFESCVLYIERHSEAQHYDISNEALKNAARLMCERHLRKGSTFDSYPAYEVESAADAAIFDATVAEMCPAF